mgnify:CR=1 FL=1
MIYVNNLFKQIIKDNFLLFQIKNGPFLMKINDDEKHLHAAMSWLEMSIINGNGGSAGNFNLLTGKWSAPFPETTGYIIPTLLNYAKEFNDDNFENLAINISEWLVSVQMDSGACIQGLYYKNKKNKPIIFNTGQNIFGFIDIYKHTKNSIYLDSAKKAGDFLVNSTDSNLLWNAALHNDIPHTYNSRTSWALLLLYLLTDDINYKKVAIANLDWVVSQQCLNGWFENASFKKNSYPNTHGLAYTIRGLIESYDILKDEKYLISAKKLSMKFLRIFEIKKILYTFWDSKFKNHDKFFNSLNGKYICLTGNIQLSLVWMRIYEITNDPIFLNSAYKMIDFIKLTHDIKINNKNINGGIKGSLPVYGRYAFSRYPNWATKFFADALMLKLKLKK